MSAPLIDGVLYGPFQRPLKLRFLVATKRMPVFSDDAHSILRQPALIMQMVLQYLHSSIANIQWYFILGCISLPGFFPIAGAPGAIPWPTERSVEVTKDR
ncbi:hypothetical protein A6U94_13395 [Agrobacterium tumefaciens]|nr:hypothetical protein A6U94_13395 [Agrobacterium tumefaciens]